MSLSELPNLGPTIVRRLKEVGIVDLATLRSVGPVEAYRMLSSEAGRALPVCYYLYSLEGALQGREWRNLSKVEKQNLRDRVFDT